jgi:outer membrane protein assembly factor BamD (BamD/ComL family)
MSPSKKMSKHQIKEDRLVTTTFRATEYIQKNPKPFVITGVVILAIFTIIVLIKYTMDKRQNNAQDLYIRANMSLAAGNIDAAVADFNSLVNDYDSTPYARSAHLSLANKYYSDKDWDRAQTEFEKLAESSGGDKMMQSIALAGVAACSEQKGDFLQAGKDYLEASNVFESPILSPEQLLKAGLNFIKAGDKTQAAEAFKKIEEKYINSSEASTARRHLAEVNL